MQNEQTRTPQKVVLMCGECLFYEEKPGPAGKISKSGECHRKAPSVDVGHEGEPATVWPIVDQRSFCGEFVPGEPRCTVKAYCHHQPQDCMACENSRSIITP